MDTCPGRTERSFFMRSFVLHHKSGLVVPFGGADSCMCSGGPRGQRVHGFPYTPMHFVHELGKAAYGHAGMHSTRNDELITNMIVICMYDIPIPSNRGHRVHGWPLDHAFWTITLDRRNMVI